MVDVSIKLNIEVDEGQVSIAELRAKVEAIANRIADELVEELEKCLVRMLRELG